MSHSRLPYADLDPTATMLADCAAAARRRSAAERLAEPAPSLRYDDFPREVAKREIRVSDAAARLAAAMELHLD